MGRQGIEIRLFMLPTDHSCYVFAAVGCSKRRGSPAIAVGLGADLSAVSAAQKAIVEMAQNYDGLTRVLRFPSAEGRMHDLAGNTGRVASMEDHGVLYASPDAIAAFDFFLDHDVEESEWPRSPHQSSACKLRQLASEISALGSECCYVNMTPNELSQLGLACVRVIVSHFQPMHFGAFAARLGGRRLFDLPVRLGLAQAPRHVSELNSDPHPLG
jgi:ribosomal protein S12 methylthiotransferase accessory factor